MGKANPGIKKVITVWLDSEGGEETEFYRCPRCGIVVAEYDGREVMEVPGNSPIRPQAINKCKGSFKRRDGSWEACGRYYVFMGVVFTKQPQSTQ